MRSSGRGGCGGRLGGRAAGAFQTSLWPRIQDAAPKSGRAGSGGCGRGWVAEGLVRGTAPSQGDEGRPAASATAAAGRWQVAVARAAWRLGEWRGRLRWAAGARVEAVVQGLVRARPAAKSGRP